MGLGGQNRAGFCFLQLGNDLFRRIEAHERVPLGQAHEQQARHGEVEGNINGPSLHLGPNPRTPGGMLLYPLEDLLGTLGIVVTDKQWRERGVDTMLETDFG